MATPVQRDMERLAKGMGAKKPQPPPKPQRDWQEVLSGLEKSKNG